MIDRGLGQWKVVVTDGGGKADVWVMADQKHANQFAEEMLDSGYKKVFVRFFPNPPLPKEHKWFVTGYLGPTFLGARGFTTKSKARTFASDLRKTGCSNVEVHEVVTLLMDAPRGSRDQYAGAPPKPFKPRKPKLRDDTLTWVGTDGKNYANVPSGITRRELRKVGHRCWECPDMTLCSNAAQYVVRVYNGRPGTLRALCHRHARQLGSPEALRSEQFTAGLVDSLVEAPKKREPPMSKPSGTPPYGEGSADFVRRALLPILQGLLEGSGWSAELVKDKT